MLYRMKVIGENLFLRLVIGLPLTPVCYFRPRYMNGWIVIMLYQVAINFNGLGNDVWKFDREPII